MADQSIAPAARNAQIIAGLNPIAAQGARSFLAAHPAGLLTSGRRSVAAQASAMASNVVLNPQWIAQTYLPSPAASACQAWVTAQAACLPAETYSGAFLAILGTFSDSDLNHLSWHLGGNAFDAQPDGDPAKIATLQGLADARNAAGGQAKFLSSEGGLTRWHLQLI